MLWRAAVGKDIVVLPGDSVEGEDAKYCILHGELDGCAGGLSMVGPLQPDGFDGWPQAAPAQASVHPQARGEAPEPKGRC